MKKEVKKTKNQTWENKCAQISSMIGGSRSKEAWRTINSLKRNTNERKIINPIKIEQWEDYYKNLLGEQRNEYLDTKLDVEVDEVEDNDVDNN